MSQIIQFAVVFGICTVLGFHLLHAQFLNANARIVQYTGVNIAGGQLSMRGYRVGMPGLYLA